MTFFRSIVGRIVIIVAAISAFVALALVFRSISRSPERIARSLQTDGRPILVVVIDTLRADHLPFYGYKRNTAPYLASLAARGVIFDNAISSSSTTAPATASIFTSRYPSEHGVIAGYVATTRGKGETSKITLNRIPENLLTLGEVMKQAGYTTFGISDNLNIGDQMGFTQGFDRFETYRYKGGDFINERLSAWKDDIQAAEKPFVFVQYMDAHKPYHEQAPWYDTYHQSSTKGARQKLIDAYDSEINFVDSHIQELVTMLGWEESALVVVTADHGEEFWDHGRDGHGKTLFREVTHVPLVVVHPKLPPARVPEFVHTMDILPTLSSLLQQPSEPSWKGQNLLTALQSGVGRTGSLLYSELLRRSFQKRSNMRSVVRDGWHFIESFDAPGEVTQELLFFMPNDPGEEHDQSQTEAQHTEALRRALADFEASMATDAEKAEEVGVSLDDDTYEQLRTLGYVE